MRQHATTISHLHHTPDVQAEVVEVQQLDVLIQGANTMVLTCIQLADVCHPVVTCVSRCVMTCVVHHRVVSFQ